MVVRIRTNMRSALIRATGGATVTIYDIQNAQKAPIWKQRIIECRSSGKSVKEWCKEHGLDFTTYYRWERKILTFMIPAEDVPVLAYSDLPAIVPTSQNAIVKVELAIRIILTVYTLTATANSQLYCTFQDDQ